MNNIRQIFDQIIEDLINPFKDPREALEVVRTPEILHFKNEELFYCLIDETPRTFKEGMIVSATVQRVFQGDKGCRIACRLENGMDGNIREERCEFFKGGAPSVDTGSIVTGRIYSIQFDGNKENPDIKFDDNFSVNLTCKQSDLRNHTAFLIDKGISPTDFHEDDLINQNFKT
jgi:transcriptional accessory protein Tex/SPT6